MAKNQLVPKSELFNQFRFIFMQKESCMLTLLTDAKKSVMMRFSDGELTSARCRSWDIENTIEALLEAENVKFSYIRSRVEDKPMLMALDDFMMLVDPGGSGLLIDDDSAAPEHESVIEVDAKPESKPELEPELVEAKKEKDFEVDKVTAARMNYF